MSSSFVRDCSDSSSSNANSSNKTLIIIVNNDSSGNVALDGNELQNILASHGADETSEVSVVQMGHHSSCSAETLAFPASLPTNDASNLMSHAVMPLNFTVDGFPSFALEGATVGGCYAELPLDADALRRLERVLETEEAREFLGEPLLDIVNNQDDLLDPFEQMMSPSDDAASSNDGSPVKFKRSAPKRRSQRQMDKAERDEVVKILAENQRMLQQERELFRKLKEEREEEERREGVINYVDGNELASVVHPVEVKCKEVSTSPTDCQGKIISTKTVDGKGKKLNATQETKGKKLNAAQEDKGKKLNVTQEGKGKGKKLNATQEGKWKKINVTQEGKGKKINVTQEDKGKKFNVTQEGKGKGKKLDATQEGKGKKLNVVQEDKVKNVNVIQEGKGKKLNVSQKGKGKEVRVTGKGIKNIPTELDSEEQENTIENLAEITGKFKGGKTKTKPLDKVSLAHSRNDNSKIIKEMPMKRLSVNVKKLDVRDIEITYDEKFSETLGDDMYSKTNLASKSPIYLEQAESTVASSQSIKIDETYKNTKISSVSSPPESISPERLNQRLMSPPRGHLRQPKTGIKNRKMVVVKSKSPTNPRHPPGSRSERTFSNSNVPEFNLQSDITDKSRTCDVNRPDTLSGELSDIVKLKTSSNILMTNKNFSDVDPMLSSLETLSTHTVTSTTTTLSPPRRKIQVVTPSEAKSVVDISANLSCKKVPIESINNTASIDAADSKFKGEKITKNVPHKEDNVKKAKISFENMLNLGNFATKTNKALKINTKNQENVLPPIKSPNNLLQHSPSISKSLMNYKIPLKNSTIRKSLEFKENSSLRKSLEFKENSSPSPQNSTLFLKNSYLTTPVFYNKAAKKSTSDIESSPPSAPSNKCLQNVLGTDSLSTKDVHSDSQNICSILQKNDKQNIELKTGLKDEPVTTIKVQPKKVKTFPPNVTTINVKTAATPPIKAPLKIVQNNSINNFSEMATKSVNNDVNSTLPNPSGVRRSVRPVKKKRFDDDIFYLGKSNSLPKKEVEREEISEDSDSEEEKNVSFVNPRVETIDSSSENSDIDIVDDDPERLWCLCQKPHNNRFMICCDRCEDWFHGSCVGVSKQLGKEMEERECEWICPNCKKAERATKGLASPPPMKDPSKGFDFNDSSADTSKKTSLKKQKTVPRVLMYEKTTGVVLSGSAAPILDALPDFLGSHPNYSCLTPEMMTQMVQDPLTGVKRIPLEILGITPKKHKKNSLSSFQDKIDSANSKSSKKTKSFRVTKFLDHSEVIQLEHETAKKPENLTTKKSSKSTPDKSSKKLNTSVFYSKDPESGKKHSTVSKDHPDYVRKHSTDKTEETPSSKKHGKESKKTPKTPDSVDKVVVKSDSIVMVRSSVQKMLLEALEKRRAEAKGEFKELTLDHLKNLCKEIEEQLYLIFNKDVGFKYKSRYRSLVFNIRDTKNGGLFRNILNGTIPPEKLACLTSEEMASKELIEWREQEEKKELEAIQKHELERIALGNQYIMKSHKGEIMIDNDELSKKNKDTDSVINLAPDQSKSLPPKDLQEDEALTNHKNHIYDPNCHICASSELHEFALSRSKEETNKESKSDRVSSEEKKEKKNHDHSKHKKKDKERHREPSKEKSPSKHSRHKDKHKEKLSSSSDESRKEKRKHRSNERDSHEERRKHRKDGHSSREEGKSKDHKRRHSQSRSEDRKRRDSESLSKKSSDGSRKKRHRESEREQSPRRKDSESDRERSPKARDSLDRDLHPSESKVSTSDDVVFVSQNSAGGVLMDSKDVEPTSTVLGTPVNEYGSDMAPLSPAESIPYPDELENESSISDQRETLVPSSDSLDVSPSTTPPLPNDNEIEEIFSPATPPLPDDVDEDRLTPPISKQLQKIQRQSQIPIWKGVINMNDVARFAVACFEVSGKPMFTKDEIQPIVEVIGRIPHDNVWSYIAQQKKSGSKEILVVRFQPSNENEKAQYIAFYSYLSSKRRYGVVQVKSGIAIKDFYIVPLASHTPIPQVLLPLDGPGFEESRPHMLIGVIVRTRRKKIYDPSAGTWIINEAPKPRTYSFDNFEDKGSIAEADDSIDELSYTPPPSFGHEDKLNDSTIDEIQESEAYSPPSEEATIQADDSFSKEEAEEQDRLDRISLLAELNRTIERDKRELSEMQKKMEKKIEEHERENEEAENSDSVIPGGENIPLDTSKISIPSNLHEILNSIKQKEVAIKEKEDEIKRRLNMVEDDRRDIFSGSKDVDLRLLLPQNPDLIGTGQDQDMRLLTNPTRIPLMPEPGHKDLRSRDPRIVNNSICVPRVEDVPTLGSMTDADLLAKAMEMEGQSSDKSHFMPPRNGPLPYSSHPPPHHLLPNPILNPDGLAPPRFVPHDMQRPPYRPPEQLPPPPHHPHPPPLLSDPPPHLNYNNSAPGPNHHNHPRNSHSPHGIPPLIEQHRDPRGEYPPYSNSEGDLRQKNSSWNDRSHVRDPAYDPRGRQGPPEEWDSRYDGGWNSGRPGFPIPALGGGPERFHPPAGPEWFPPPNRDNFDNGNRKRRFPGGRRPPMNFPHDQHKRRDQRW